MIVRVLRPEDGPALALCVAEVLPRTWSARAIAEELLRPDARILGAFERDRLVGFAMFRVVLDEAELLLIGVVEEARRRGLAWSVWTESARRLTREGVLKVFLEVRESNAAARGFYARAGFLEMGRRRGYYAAPVEDAVILALVVAPEDPPQHGA